LSRNADFTRRSSNNQRRSESIHPNAGFFCLFRPVWASGGVRVTPVAYWEMFGAFEPGGRRPFTGDAVVFSSIEQGSASSPASSGLCVRFVGRGREDYRVNGKACRVDAGQIMISPQDSGAEIEIRRDECAGTVGLCALIRNPFDDLAWDFGPLVTSASASALGATMERSAKTLWTSARPKQEVASELVATLRSELPSIARSMLEQVASMEAAKPVTRFEMVRRAHLAQAYLHAVTGRAVELAEVATAIGYSPFQLLRAFQHCFGDTPAGYHRKLRLNLALDEAARRGVPVGVVCDEFGFAGASSFSHVYRRAFGHAPTRRAA
jgi:AraC-like DNA-binding protein